MGLPSNKTMLGQAIITGCFVGFGSISLGFLMGWTRPWAAGAFFASLVSFFAWITFLSDYRKLLAAIHGVEQYQPAIEEPEPARVLVVNDNQGYPVGQYSEQTTWLDDNRLLQVAQAIISEGADLSMARWAGRGRLFSRGEYEGLRQFLLDAKLASWKDNSHHNLGIQLTGAGRGLMRKFASQLDSPTLTMELIAKNNGRSLDRAHTKHNTHSR